MRESGRNSLKKGTVLGQEVGLHGNKTGKVETEVV